MMGGQDKEYGDIVLFIERNKGGCVMKKLALCVLLMTLGIGAFAQQRVLYLEGGLGLGGFEDGFDNPSFDVALGWGMLVDQNADQLLYFANSVFIRVGANRNMLFGYGLRYYPLTSLQLSLWGGVYADMSAQQTVIEAGEEMPVTSGFGFQFSLAYEFSSQTFEPRFQIGTDFTLGWLKSVQPSMGFFVKAILR
jgi:hypothetical protein